MTRRARRATVVLALALAPGSAASAQPPDGHVSIAAVYLPEQRHTAEIRARVFVEQAFDPLPWLRLNLSGFTEALLANRPEFGAEGTRGARDATLQVREAHVELRAANLDVVAGYATVVWGRLDELQPTDVVNPIDASRFFFAGRSEARLPVLVARARLALGEGAALEGLYVPGFRRGRYDLLDEETSPFNPTRAAVGLRRIEPSWRASNAQGGARLSVTTGRVDWSLAAWRGFEPFGVVNAEPVAGSAAASLVLRYPRFTMVGADFETVSGGWGVRGEVAVFTEDTFQAGDLTVVEGRSVDAGLGVDRRAGDVTMSATILLHVERPEAGPAPAFQPRRDVTLIGSAERTFARERYRARAFGVYNPAERTAFLRGIGSIGLQDNVALEGSLGWFAGRGRDLVGRFADNDFAYLTLRYYF